MSKHFSASMYELKFHNSRTSIEHGQVKNCKLTCRTKVVLFTVKVRFRFLWPFKDLLFYFCKNLMSLCFQKVIIFLVNKWYRKFDFDLIFRSSKIDFCQSLWKPELFKAASFEFPKRIKSFTSLLSPSIRYIFFLFNLHCIALQ